MRGWVYIITNKAMPGLIKVGYTMKDPELRAAELHHTGAPHPYNVDYDVLVENPREIEQQVHCHLNNKKEGKEWFRCTIKDAITAIKVIASTKAILENIKSVDSAKPALVQQPIIQVNLNEIALNDFSHEDSIGEKTKSVDIAKSSLTQQSKPILDRDIPGPKDFSREDEDRGAYNHRLLSLMQEFNYGHKFSLEDWKAYAKKNKPRLEPIPDDSKKWLD